MTLHHSFDSLATHSFKALKTKNIMDYYNKSNGSDPRKSTWKWQWERLWNWHANK